MGFIVLRMEEMREAGREALMATVTARCTAPTKWEQSLHLPLQTPALLGCSCSCPCVFIELCCISPGHSVVPLSALLAAQVIES